MNNETTKTKTSSAARRCAREWQKLADAAEARHKKQCDRGDVFKTDTAAGIQTLRNVATAYRMEHKTGLPHCSVHMVPRGECPKGSP